MNDPLRAAVVGCGAVGSGYDEDRRDGPPLTHAGALSASPAIELLAGVDPGEPARERFQRRWQVPAFATVAELYELHPQLVSIATPPAGRAQVVREVLALDPAALWIEKPLAASLPEALAIAHECERAGVVAQVNFLRRFDPLHREVVAAVHERGPASHLDARFSGSLSNFGAHAVDIFRWVVGEVDAVDAAVLGDATLVLLRARSGSTGTLMRVPADGTTVFDVDIRDRHSRHMLTGLGREYARADAATSDLFPGVTSERLDEYPRHDGVGPAMGEAAGALVAAVREGTPVPCSIQDGVAALQVQVAIERSLAERRPVEVAR